MTSWVSSQIDPSPTRNGREDVKRTSAAEVERPMRMRGSGARRFRCEEWGADTFEGVTAGAGAGAGAATGALGIGARDDLPPQAGAVKARTTSAPRIQVFTNFISTWGS